jgi:hypothetical protein
MELAIVLRIGEMTNKSETGVTAGCAVYNVRGITTGDSSRAA